jgi:hypothetical protein
LTVWKLAELERDIPPEVMGRFKPVEEGDEFFIDPKYVGLFQIWKSWIEQSKKPKFR